jgi:hypothetical protein
MTNPNISIYDHATGETEIRPMTDEEFAFSQLSGELPADYTIPKP